MRTAYVRLLLRLSHQQQWQLSLLSSTTPGCNKHPGKKQTQLTVSAFIGTGLVGTALSNTFLGQVCQCPLPVPEHLEWCQPYSMAPNSLQGVGKPHKHIYMVSEKKSIPRCGGT